MIAVDIQGRAQRARRRRNAARNAKPAAGASPGGTFDFPPEAEVA
ncbi:hypothetical protein GCM10023235_55370 [Kitasatospora terrestris]|uniref:Uncharacterized protein n=1 Tax=Kitasatospora terrestris TaxID=258051 RepID=A0ABP9E8H9_9ACTN